MFSFVLGFGVSSIILFIILILFLLKVYVEVTKGIHRGNERLDGKTVIVTGSCSGLGAEVSKDLARRGARVIMVCKELERGEKVRQDIVEWSGNKNVVLKQVDFSSLDSVRRCANEILAEESRIDVLLNNAGTSGLGTKNITPDGLDVLMQTNYFGPFLFTNLLIGKIKATPSSRIVNVSSFAHRFALLNLDDLIQKNVFLDAVIYCNSKLAVNLFTLHLSLLLKETGVTVNCLHPGGVRTRIVQTYGSVAYFLWTYGTKFYFKNSWEGAQTSIFLCVSSSVAKITGKYFSDCKESKPCHNSLDYSRAAKLWELSEIAVKLRESEKHI